MEVIESGMLGRQEDWQRIAEMIRSIAKRELGETLGKIITASRRETWWWNQEVQEKLKDKKKVKKAWIPSEMMQASWPITLQEINLREKWQRQETRHMTKQRRGENEVFKIAKQRNRQSKDVQQVRVLHALYMGRSEALGIAPPSLSCESGG